MSKLCVQVQVATDAARTMLRATWPRAVKVMQDGVDRATLQEMADHGLEMVVGRYVFAETGNEAEVEARCNVLLAWADENLRWLEDRGVRVVLEVPYNEELQNGEALDRLNELTLRAMPRILAHGYDAAIGVFSEGNPSGQGHPNPFVDWPKFYPALRQARQYWDPGHFPDGRVFLALHEYSVPGLGPVDGWHAFRYRKVWNGDPEKGWAGLPEDCRIPILVTEAGIDGGIEGMRRVGWRGYGLTPAKYAQWLWTTRTELEKDPYVWFSFVFLCGTTESRGWTSFDVTDEVDLRSPLTRGMLPPRWSPVEVARVPTLDELQTLARGVIRAFGLDEAILFRQIAQESNWNPRAVSRSGAKGLMQLMDATAAMLGVTNPFDPRQNLTGGCKYMAQMLAKYGGSYEKALAAYNWGPGNLDRLLATNPPRWQDQISDQAKHYLAAILPQGDPPVFDFDAACTQAWNAADALEKVGAALKANNQWWFGQGLESLGQVTKSLVDRSKAAGK